MVERRHAITLLHTVQIRRDPAEVYSFLVHDVPAHYRELSGGHERFEVEGGGPLRPGAVVDCRERAGTQEVHHRYVVTALEPERRVALDSVPSRSFVHAGGRRIEGRCETRVRYALAPADGGTTLRMSIEIAFSSAWQRLVAKVLGRTHVVWGRHQREELDKLARLLEGAPLSATAGS